MRALTCPQCGASIDSHQTTRLLSCLYCGTRLIDIDPRDILSGEYCGCGSRSSSICTACGNSLCLDHEHSLKSYDLAAIAGKFVPEAKKEMIRRSLDDLILATGIDSIFCNSCFDQYIDSWISKLRT